MERILRHHRLTLFKVKMLLETLEIPSGRTATYSEIAAAFSR